MKARDDFAKLDDFSYELCLKTLEDYESMRNTLEDFVGTLGELSPEIFETLDALLGKFGKSRAVCMSRSILSQMRSETFPEDGGN